MEAKLKHLEFIQNIITRMNSNSFSIKKWMITLVSAIIALGYNKDINSMILFFSLPIIILFWWLDSFFLYQERLFRSLYDNARIVSPDDINFSMDTRIFDYKNNTSFKSNSIKSTFFSNTIGILYGAFFVLMLITSIVANLETLKESFKLLLVITIISLITKSYFWYLINKK